MWKHRLLKKDQSGSALVSTVAAIMFLLVLVLGIVQVVWTLYARNVTMSSAHEAARALLEYGADQDEAGGVAEEVIRRAAGGLIEEAVVVTRLADSAGTRTVTVVVRARLRPLGPVPYSPGISASATASTLAGVP